MLPSKKYITHWWSNAVQSETVQDKWDTQLQARFGPRLAERQLCLQFLIPVMSNMTFELSKNTAGLGPISDSYLLGQE